MSYACDVCNRTFGYTSILKLHYRSHTGEKPFKCKFCSESFSHEAHLIVHNQLHSQKEQHVCELCSKTFLWKSALEEHTKLHKGEIKNKEFVTEGFCNENGFDRFPHEAHLIVLNQLTTLSQKEQHVCEFCNKMFLRKSSWEEHTEWHKSEAKNKQLVTEGFCNENALGCDEGEKPPSENKRDQIVSIPSRILRKQRSFICDTCGEIFSEEESFKAHKNECNICNKSFSRKLNVLKLHRPVNSNEKHYDCDICGKLFSRMGSLNIHRRIHTREKPFECEICCQSFSRKDKLNLHYRVHTNEKPFKCNKCGKLFSRMDHLTIHRRIHTREKPFECDVCEQSFSRKDKLKLHHRTHTNDKPFRCNICGQLFSRSEKLKLHLRVHIKTEPLCVMDAVRHLH